MIPRPLTNPLKLNKDIRRQILDYVLVSEDPIIIDLNRRKQLEPELLYVTRVFYTEEFERYCGANSFTLRVGFKIRGPEIFALNALEEWVFTKSLSNSQGDVRNSRAQWTRKICLDFETLPDQPTTLDHIQIDFSALLRLDAWIAGFDTSVQIQMRTFSNSLVPHGGEKV
ncbi:hypothetical protein GQ44DRAFT_702298 [Phaeosphaeriaceae sp. PMI808]|nr:hypothetical protein GQ44DRAFT_702298 [Phaeosphaeriaceae sp. PMI808]